MRPGIGRTGPGAMRRTHAASAYHRPRTLDDSPIEGLPSVVTCSKQLKEYFSSYPSSPSVGVSSMARSSGAKRVLSLEADQLAVATNTVT